MHIHPTHSPTFFWPIARDEGPEEERRYWGGDKMITVGVICGVSLLIGLPIIYYTMCCVVRNYQARRERKEARDLERQAAEG